MNPKRIHIDPAWQFRDEAGNTIDPRLFRLLQQIHHHQKLTLAAKGAAMSYRHSWNLLNKWSEFFGTKLVELHKGRGAKLTSLGEKLLWAEQRVMARFQPQMANLASELNVEIQKTLTHLTPELKVQASHGYAVALLPEICENLQLNLQYSTPLEALSGLNRDTCDLAGLHMPRGIVVPALQKKYRALIKPRTHIMMRFITRQQGLMVRPGNPHNILTLSDLTKPEIRFINRQVESGTRALFDQLLANQQIDTADIDSYHSQEFTHSAVAAYVAADMADAGFGVSHAAHLFGLDFIPLCEEDYVFILHKKNLQKAAITQFIHAIQQNPFLEKLSMLSGYKADNSGEIQNLNDWLNHP